MDFELRVEESSKPFFGTLKTCAFSTREEEQSMSS